MSRTNMGGINNTHFNVIFSSRIYLKILHTCFSMLEPNILPLISRHALLFVYVKPKLFGMISECSCTQVMNCLCIGIERWLLLPNISFYGKIFF